MTRVVEKESVDGDGRGLDRVMLGLSLLAGWAGLRVGDDGRSVLRELCNDVRINELHGYGGTRSS